ncbi:MAG: hypothetical protein ACI9W4_000317 [Rhodothermales bacterium]|jgi:uncharacterized protein (DUF1684 family)
MTSTRSLLLLVTACILAGCSPNTIPPQVHEADIQAWRAWRLADLTSEDSWLTLIGYHWVGAVPVSVGSAERASITLPRGPQLVGTFFQSDGALLFEAKEGVTVIADSVTLAEAVPVFNPDGSAVIFRVEAMSWLVRDFQDRLAVRVRDNRALLRTEFPGIEHYPVNSEWRLHARYEPYDPPKRFPVAIFTGGDDLEESPGRVIFEAAGTEYSLDVTDTSDTGYFVIFADDTNGNGSYPAGRYVWFDKPVGARSGPVVLDFNKAYNPPCAFTEYATCPLPPRSHRIAAEVDAGELTFARPK